MFSEFDQLLQPFTVRSEMTWNVRGLYRINGCADCCPCISRSYACKLNNVRGFSHIAKIYLWLGGITYGSTITPVMAIAEYWTTNGKLLCHKCDRIYPGPDSACSARQRYWCDGAISPRRSPHLPHLDLMGLTRNYFSTEDWPDYPSGWRN